MYKHIVLLTSKMNFYSDLTEISIKPAVLKLGVAKCPKKVAKLKKKRMGFLCSKQAKNWGFNMVFLHLEGSKISKGSGDISDKLRGSPDKKVWEPLD
jgi:hypothetical protein